MEYVGQRWPSLGWGGRDASFYWYGYIFSNCGSNILRCVSAPDLRGGHGARAQGAPPKGAPHHVYVFCHMYDMCVLL